MEKRLNMKRYFLGLFALSVLFCNVKAQPYVVTSNIPKALLNPDPRNPNVEPTMPLLQIVDVRFEEKSVLGKRVDSDPNWLIKAEVKVKNISAYEVQSAYLVMRSPKGIVALVVAKWNCPSHPNKKCRGASAQAIKPGETVTLPSAVQLLNLQRYREIMAVFKDTTESGNLEWTFFRTTDRYYWKSDGTFFPMPPDMK
jgi:hypothetical protein